MFSALAMARIVWLLAFYPQKKNSQDFELNPSFEIFGDQNLLVGGFNPFEKY